MSDSLDRMDCSPPGSSVHEISQARVLEWAEKEEQKIVSLDPIHWSLQLSNFTILRALIQLVVYRIV